MSGRRGSLPSIMVPYKPTKGHLISEERRNLIKAGVESALSPLESPKPPGHDESLSIKRSLTRKERMELERTLMCRPPGQPMQRAEPPRSSEPPANVWPIVRHYDSEDPSLQSEAGSDSGGDEGEARITNLAGPSQRSLRLSPGPEAKLTLTPFPNCRAGMLGAHIFVSWVTEQPHPFHRQEFESEAPQRIPENRTSGPPSRAKRFAEASGGQCSG